MVIAILIGLGLYLIIRMLVFKGINNEYVKAVTPIFIWGVACVTINIFCSITCISIPIKAIAERYDGLMNFGSLFGSMGVQIAGSVAQWDAQNYRMNNPEISRWHDDCMDCGFNSLLLSIISAIVLLFIVIGIRSQKKYSPTAQSILYFIIGITSVISLWFMTICLTEGLNVNNLDGYENANPTVYGCTVLIIASVGMIAFYATKYRNILSVAYNTPMTKALPQPMSASIKSKVQSFVNPLPVQLAETKPTKACPFCGETILAVAVKCKHCGEWLNKEEPKKYVQCQVCGEDVEEGLEVCPFCHEKVDGSSAKKEPKMITCPICAEQIPADADICPICNEKIK